MSESKPRAYLAFELPDDCLVYRALDVEEMWQPLRASLAEAQRERDAAKAWATEQALEERDLRKQLTEAQAEISRLKAEETQRRRQSLVGPSVLAHEVLSSKQNVGSYLRQLAQSVLDDINADGAQ